MSVMFACIKKEFLEQLRSGRLLFLGLLFTLFGIMNPAIAKLTPWLLDTMAESLAESGMIVTDVKVSAMDSWVQFFKNVPMALIAFTLLESSVFTKEYQSGTLLLSLTKGLSRVKVIAAKTVALAVLWSAGYWLCYGITYAYNAYFWDNTVAQNLVYSVMCWWVFGLWVIGLLVLFSVVADNNSVVLALTGGTVAASWLLEFLPKAKNWLPTILMDGNSLIYGVQGTDVYHKPLAAALLTTVACLMISVPVFNKKQL